MKRPCAFGDWRGRQRQQIRELLAKLLLILASRSECLLKLFSETDVAVSSPDCLPQLYSAVLENGSVFPGLRPEKPRDSHTTEQKTWSLGKLVDAALLPRWQDSTHYDQLLRGPQHLKSYQLFGSGMVFSHTYEYINLLLAGKVHARQALKEGPIESGRNGAAFLRIVNTTPERCETPR